MKHPVFIAGPEGESLHGLVKGLQAYGHAVLSCPAGEDLQKSLKAAKQVSAVLVYASFGADSMRLIRKCCSAKVPILVLKDAPIAKEECAAMGVRSLVAPPFSSADIHQLLRDLAAPGKEDFSSRLSLRQQVTGVTVAVVIFLAFLSYFILIPMFLGAKLKTGNQGRSGYHKINKIIKGKSY